ncbi:HemK2/MTQ2 family protein methyltransferase [Salinibaculum rarum]|uniref:HemK2/MTQ2 family protein methyltransferase n=1 Tax=Salinibaculum rarum TaxID=3058903 RepID=UPI00265E0902|nr:HemK2/MTQ2 family protein methyltransferase [Salinibaculum sp. KK48]
MGDGDRPSLADQRDTETVYQPAEDSKLLADTAVAYTESGDWVLDVGTGSGYIAHRFGEETAARVVGSDLNPNACRQARDAGVSVVRADQLTPFRDGAFDVVVFNPPYLPTEPDREWDDWMETALSGGESGREVIEPFLDDLYRVLAPDGDAFLLVSSLTGIDAVRDYARGNGLTTMEAATESHPYEKLVVLHLRPTGAPDTR